MNVGSISLRIDSRLENVFLVGLSINRICTALSMSEEQAYEVELCVVEAVNNVIEHAYHQESGHPIEVVVDAEPERLRIQVRDHGAPVPWAEVRAAALARGARTELDEGGRGLFIILTLMDEVTYEREGETNVLTLVRRRPAPGGGRDARSE